MKSKPRASANAKTRKEAKCDACFCLSQEAASCLGRRKRAPKTLPRQLGLTFFAQHLCFNNHAPAKHALAIVPLVCPPTLLIRTAGRFRHPCLNSEYQAPLSLLRPCTPAAT